MAPEAITNIRLGDKYTHAQHMLERLAAAHKPHVPDELIPYLDPMCLGELNEVVRSGGDLSMEEAFAGMALVVAATNNPFRQKYYPGMSYEEAIAKGTAFLVLMASKEASSSGLKPEEVAGTVAAGLSDLAIRPILRYVVETCGMGGDRGWNIREKTINASTLSSLVLASLGMKAFKHGSYGNTTKVGSTDVPIRFGARICQQGQEEINRLIKEVGYWFSDAHAVKTLHYLSHLLMMETINHIVGPMTIPVSAETQLFKVMGVNHFIHPRTIAQAYAILHQRKLLNVGRIAVMCGLDQCPKGNQINDDLWVREHSFLDELSPFATLLAITEGGNFLGIEVVTLKEIGSPHITQGGIMVKNYIPTLMRANERAIRGLDPTLTSYLAANAAIGSWICNEGPICKSELPRHYLRCWQAIKSGRAYDKLVEYVEATGGRICSFI